MASKLSSPHRRKGFVLECRSSKLRLGEKMPSTFWDAAFWGLLPPALSLSPLEFSAHATIASCRPLRSGRPARPRPREEGAQQLGHSRKQHRRHCLSQSLRHSERRIRLCEAEQRARSLSQDLRKNAVPLQLGQRRLQSEAPAVRLSAGTLRRGHEPCSR